MVGGRFCSSDKTLDFVGFIIGHCEMLQAGLDRQQPSPMYYQQWPPPADTITQSKIMFDKIVLIHVSCLQKLC